MNDAITVRCIKAHEWERLRSLRLRALADAPMAFGSTLAREQAFPESVWRERAAAGAAGNERATFVAEDGGEWVGSAAGMLDSEGTGERPVWVVGMWVDPAVRGRGVGGRLLGAIAGWARQRDADVLNLQVTETNAPAIALYERLGFRASGETQPLPHTPSLRELHMLCPLVEFRAG
jgi:GNAT superfamily N-acetyltransferase